MPLTAIPSSFNNADARGAIFGQFIQNSAGARNQVDDWSAAPESFFIAPPTDTILVLNRIVIDLVTGTNNIRADGYGGGGSGVVLTNGVIIRTADNNGVTEDFTDTLPILNNANWARFCYDTMETIPSAGPTFITTRWSWFKHGKPIILDGRLSTNPIFEIVLEDNLSLAGFDLTEQTTYCGGYTVTP